LNWYEGIKFQRNMLTLCCQYT